MDTNSFYDSLANARLYLRADGANVKANADIELQKHLKAFIIVLKSASPRNIAIFIDSHKSDLRVLKDALLNPALKLKYNPLHNSIFQTCLKMNKRPSSNTTELFQKFIQGITLFRDQDIGNREPIYHRLLACGPGSDQFRQEFGQCSVKDSRKKRMDIKDRIERCYKERLLYNEIYKQLEFFFPSEVRSQDPGHVNWIDVTKNDFASCFPNVDFKVKVVMKKFSHTTVPKEVTFERILKGNTQFKETYTKFPMADSNTVITYAKIVECVKVVFDQDGKEIMTSMKYQNFDKQEKQWKRSDD